MSPQDLRAAIEAADREFEATFGRGDAEGMAALYTKDGQILPTGGEFVSGREAIRTFWQGAMDMGIRRAQLEPIEVEGTGDTAHEVGRYTLRGAEDQVLDQGKYIVIWKQGGGQWKMHRDIFNSSLAPQG